MAPLQPRLAPLRRALGAALVVFLLICAVVYYRGSTGVPTAASTVGSTTDPDPTPTPAPAGTPSSPPTFGDDSLSPSPSAERRIELEGLPVMDARRFETVPIRGTYHGGRETLLRVQRREGNKWTNFPIPTVTDTKGRFSTHIELERPGPYWIRVMDAQAEVASAELVLNVRR